MAVQSIRQTIIWSLVATTIWSAIAHRFSDDATILGTLAMSPVLLVIMFFTMRMTNRFTGAVTRRFVAKRPDAESDATPEPAEATSMRPEHAQRRRTRRRRRRGRR